MSTFIAKIQIEMFFQVLQDEDEIYDAAEMILEDLSRNSVDGFRHMGLSYGTPDETDWPEIRIASEEEFATKIDNGIDDPASVLPGTVEFTVTADTKKAAEETIDFITGEWDRWVLDGIVYVADWSVEEA